MSYYCLHAAYLPTLYDFHFDGVQMKWVPWSSLVEKYIHIPEMKFADILGNSYFSEQYFFFCIFEKKQKKNLTSLSIQAFEVGSKFFLSFLVPTVDTTRASWILEQMVKIKRPVLLVGESGTSKTATILNFLKHINSDTWVISASNHSIM